MPRDIPVERLRNIGIMAHIDAGKTTCAERILFATGRIHRTGEVHHGDTVLDFDPLEQQRGITINAAATTVTHREHRIQIVDTPGHVDFSVEVERSLRVLDGAVFVLDASRGVECQSEAVFRQAARFEVPCIAFVNKIDKTGANFDACLSDVRRRLGIAPAVVHRPIGEGTSEIGILDVLERTLLRFDPRTGGRSIDRHAVPEDARPSLEAARQHLVETLAEHDDEVMAVYCSGQDVAADVLRRALRKATLARRVLVVTCGSALRNVGIPSLLDAVVDYLPHPAELPALRGRLPDGDREVFRPRTDDAPLTALVFKTTSDRTGTLTYLRLYAGVLEAGSAVRLGHAGSRERIGRIFLPHADAHDEVPVAHAGAIVAVTGLRAVRTGETVCSREEPIVLERFVAPEPVVEVAIEPVTHADRERLPSALARLTFDDPSLRAAVDEESGQVRLRGMGRLHLEVSVDKLRRDHTVAVHVGRPRVAYRETVARSGQAAYRHVKQQGGAGQFACVTLSVRPAPRGSGLTFVDETVGGVVPKEYVQAVERGVRAAANRGVFTGHPVVDVHVVLSDGRTHVKDSNATAFELAASMAFQAACRDAGLVLLEPFAAIDVEVPEAHTGDVLGDFGARRGTVARVTARDQRMSIVGRVPLGETFDYVTTLRGMTHGRGHAVIVADGYEPAPPAVVEQVLV